MKVFETISELKKEIDFYKTQEKTIGFVPTMGALHQGHLSLTDCSKSRCDITVVSIFVNPTQFNNKADLEKYPRNLEKDLQLLTKKNIDMVFTPSVEEMYPEKDERNFNFGDLETVMEGKFRPGHFNGVAQIVSKLFDAVNPDKAFFGLKDFQQLAVIKAMVKQLNYNIEILPCNIIREANGLAMSSRNERLTPEQRNESAIIYQTLKFIKENKDKISPNKIKEQAIQKIHNNSNLKVEYIEIVDDDNLKSINSWQDSKNITACAAVYYKDVRLIDNLKI